MSLIINTNLYQMKKLSNNTLNFAWFGKITGKKVKTNSTDRETSSSEGRENLTVEPIDGTPFGTVKRNENDFVVVFGKHMISPKSFISRRQAEDWVKKTDWITLLNVMGIMIEHYSNLKTNQN